MIEVKAVTKRYGPVTAVDDLSFQVLPGRVTGFLGTNGAGKSTTMRLILGLDAPTSGSTTVNGTPFGHHRFPAHEVGALLDALAVHPGRRARAHLTSLAQGNRIGSARVDEVLDLVGLTSVASRRIGPFSLGMKQRLGIAAAMLGDPEILLFDEPVTGLDPEGIVWIRGLFHQLAAEGRTILVSSHLMTEMALTAQRLIVIGRGRLIADDTIDNLLAGGTSSVKLRAPRQDELAALLMSIGGHVSTDDGALRVTGLDAAAIGDLAALHGIALHELAPQHETLEDVFFELTGDQIEYHGATADPPAHAAVETLRQASR
jgi:ABC-2 type transport system ATP-binding protein